MNVGEIMSTNVHLIRLETPLSEAAELMKNHDVGALPVTDGEKIKGMLTDRDIVIRAVCEGKDLNSTPASEVMTQRIRFIFDDEDVSKAADAMQDKQIRRLVVLNRSKRLVGLMSLGDLARKGDESLSGHVMRSVSKDSSSASVTH